MRLYLDDPNIERPDVPGVDAIYEVLFSEMANLAARFLPSVPLYTLRDDKGFKQEYAKKFNLGGSQKQNAGAHVRLTNDSCFCSNRLPLTLS